MFIYINNVEAKLNSLMFKLISNSNEFLRATNNISKQMFCLIYRGIELVIEKNPRIPLVYTAYILYKFTIHYK